MGFYGSTSSKTISEHLLNIYEERELDPKATVWKFQIVQTEGKREELYQKSKKAALNKKIMSELEDKRITPFWLTALAQQEPSLENFILLTY